jgi:inosine/xanthosine triphosphatase
MKKVLVASKNKIKALAVEEAFKIFSEETTLIEPWPADIPSGVADQPTSLEESAKGAINRLDAIADAAGYDYYVSIEGGMYCVDTAAGKRWFEAACAAVRNGNKSSIAYGPGYPVPDRLVSHILDGKDLNQAIEHEIGIKEIGSAGGFNGWLTEEKLDRQKGSAQAVLLALYGLRHQ